METDNRPRQLWINCARAVAMFGVLVFHAGYKLAMPSLVIRMGLNCVVLFMLLGGVTTAFSLLRHAGESYFTYCKRRLPPLIIPYLAVCCCYQFAKFNRFVLPDMLRAIVTFSYEEHLYYIFVYLQLLLLAPLLNRLLSACERAKHPLFAHALAVLFIAAFSCASMRYTFLLPLSGNGAYLLGGSFLLCFYLGMLIARRGLLSGKPRIRLFVGIAALLLWVLVIGTERLLLPLSPAWLFAYSEFNPPSAMLLLQGLLMLYACYGLSDAFMKPCATRWLVRLLDYIGRYTLYMYLYMLLIRAFIYGRVPIENVHLLRLVTFTAMLALPILGKRLWDFVYTRAKRFLDGRQ